MKRNIVIAAVTAAALIGGGTATALAVADEDERTVRQSADVADTGTDDQDTDTAQTESAKVTAAEAIAAALDHTSGTVVSAELDDRDDDGDDDGPAAWEVDVLAGGDTWHNVRIDPVSGEVLGSHTEHEDDTAEVRAALKGASVTAAEAADAVTGKGTVTSVDLDEDGTTRGWDVETRGSGTTERDWNVDLRSGKATADTADDDQDDDHSDDNDGDDD